MTSISKSLYTRLTEAGCQTDSHASDLYVKATPEARAIIEAFEKGGGIANRKTFSSAIDKALWYDLPFHFDPWWEKRGQARK